MMGTNVDHIGKKKGLQMRGNKKKSYVLDIPQNKQKTTLT
jgi:hypothetical protein